MPSVTQSDFGVGISGLGKYLPRKTITNAELGKKIKILPSEISERSGITTRHFAGKDESASRMSADAANAALRQAGVKADKINLIICCTTSGDYLFPATAAKVQGLIGAEHAAAFDLSASAASFPLALGLAHDRLRSRPELNHILVIGTAVQSPFIDWRNHSLAALLGDGSGAALLSRVPVPYGILANESIVKGELFEAARLRGGGSAFPMKKDNVDQGLQYIEMDGPTIGREFLKTQPQLIDQALSRAGLKRSDIDLIIFHQANLRLIQYAMERLKLPMSKTYANVSRVGNTAEASIPMALCEAGEKGLIKRGSLVVLSGVGAGCILSVTVMRWH